jgi:membrane protein YdbS with pleckstrin-like domain
VPVLDKAELQHFMAELKLPSATWKDISPFFIINLGGWFSLIFGTLLAIVLAATDHSFFWLLLLIPSIFLLVWRRWCCWGVYHDDEWFVVKTGFIGQRITFMPAPKTQKTAIYQPLWLRPLSLVQLGVWSGAGAVYVPALEQSWAQSVRDRLQWQVVSYKKRWF